MASIERRETKQGVSYRIRVFVGRDSNGKNKRESLTFTPDQNLSPAKQQKQAEKFAMEYEEKILNGQVLSGDRITVEEYCLDWLKEAKSRLTPGSYSYYEAFLTTRFIPALGHLKLSNVKAAHLKSFLYDLKGTKGQTLKSSSYKKYLTILKSVFSTAWRDEIIENNPAEKVRAPHQEEDIDKVKCFTADEAKRFLEFLDKGLTYSYSERTRKTTNGVPYQVKSYSSTHEISNQYKIFFSIALLGGLRRSEILALTWSDVDFTENVIHITKSVCYVDKKIFVKTPKTKSSVRSIRLPASLMDNIKKYRKEWLSNKLKLGSSWAGEGDFLFIQENGKILHPSSPYHKFKEILMNYNSTVTDEKLKLPMISLHDLRHTSASLLLTNHVDLMTVSKRLGHSKKSTTLDIYAHIIEDIDAVASDKMEDLFFSKEA